jgi:uncharacterized protein
MKYAVVILVVLLGVWLWRKNRADDRRDDTLPGSGEGRKNVEPSGTPQIMVRCAVCQVHLPQVDALAGKKNHYCSQAHLAQREP